MLPYFNKCILCFIFCFYASAKGMVGGSTIINVNTKANNRCVSLAETERFDPSSGWSRNYIAHTPIIIENGQLKEPIHVYGTIDFIFDERFKIGCLGDQIGIWDNSLDRLVIKYDYDRQVQYFIVFYYKSQYRVQVKNILEFESCADDIKNLETVKKEIDVQEKRFLNPVKCGVMAVVAILTYLFYWKYYKVV